MATTPLRPSANAAALDLSSNLEATLAGRAAVVDLFLSRRMACPGCPMAAFETPSPTRRATHCMDGEELLAAVREAAARDRRAVPVRSGGGAPRRAGGAANGSGGESGGRRAPHPGGCKETS